MDSPIYLFELSYFDPLSSASKFFFCSYPDVIFKGRKYEALSRRLDGIEFSSEGTLPMPKLIVSDKDRVISALAELYDGFEGATLRVIETRPRFLDGGSSPDNSASITTAILTVESSTSIPGRQITFDLAVAFAFAGGETIPTRGIYQTCQFIYRGNQCQYTGSAKFDINDNPTTDTSKDQCGKKVSSCRLRFPNVLRFGGYPAAKNSS
jgi:lambda family phage minor tail protein L